MKKWMRMMKELILKRMVSRYVCKNKGNIIYNILYDFQIGNLRQNEIF